MSQLDFLTELAETISERLRLQPQGSYVASLAQAGHLKAAQKVGEEGLEVALASAGEGRDRLIEESADLLFHLLVLLQMHEASLDDVVQVLRARHAG